MNLYYNYSAVLMNKYPKITSPNVGVHQVQETLDEFYFGTRICGHSQP